MARARGLALLGMIVTAGCAARQSAVRPLESADKSAALSAATLCGGITYESLAISPDGREVAFTSDRSGAFEVWTVPFDGSTPPRQRTHAGEHARGLVYSPAGDLLLYENDHGGDEITDLFLLRAGASEPEQLTKSTQAEHAAQFSPDGKRIAFENDFDRPFLFDIAVMELDTRAVTRLTRERINVRAPRWSPAGDQIAATRTADDQRGDLMLIDWPKDEAIPIAPPVAGGIFWPAGFTRIQDGLRGQLVILGGRAINELGWFTLTNLTLGAPLATALDHKASGEVELVAVGDVYTHYSLHRASEGIDSLYVIDHSGHRAMGAKDNHVAIDTTGTALTALSADRSGEHAVALVESPHCPGSIARILGGKIETLVPCELPGAELSRLPRTERVVGKSAEGLSIDAWVTRPNELRLGNPAPLIVLVHGGPESEARAAWYPQAMALAEAGFVVAQPNYRGSSGHGKKFLDANNQDWGGGDLQDLLAIADELAARKWVDPKRVGITGGSYGGYLTLRAITAAPERFAAAVESFGMADLVLDYQASSDRFATWYETEMGNPQKDAALFHDRSPIHSLDKVRAPLLVMQGANDTNVPKSESEALVAALKQLGKPVEYVVYPDEGHEFFLRKNRIDSIARTVEFFTRQLGGR